MKPYITFCGLLISALLLGFTPQKPAPAVKKRLEEGAKLYAKYSCNGCHGTDGKGLGDLRLAYKKYSAAEIEGYIKEPAKYGNSRMPAFNDIIAATDYPLLVEYIISLGKGAEGK